MDRASTPRPADDPRPFSDEPQGYCSPTARSTRSSRNLDSPNPSPSLSPAQPPKPNEMPDSNHPSTPSSLSRTRSLPTTSLLRGGRITLSSTKFAPAKSPGPRRAEKTAEAIRENQSRFISSRFSSTSIPDLGSFGVRIPPPVWVRSAPMLAAVAPSPKSSPPTGLANPDFRLGVKAVVSSSRL